MISFFSQLIKLNFFISFCASSLYLLYAYIGESNFPLSNLIFVFSSVTLGYFFLQNIGKIKNKDFQLKNNKFLLTYNLLHLILLFYFFPILNFTSISILILGTLVFLSYELLLNLSLRRNPFLKPISIGFVWATLIVGINDSLNFKSFMDCFFFISLLSIPFDLKDLDYDKSQKILTLPQIVPHLPRVIIILSLIFTGIFFEREEFLFFVLFIPIMAFSIFNHSKLKPWMYYLIFDGLIFLRSFLYFF